MARSIRRWLALAATAWLCATGAGIASAAEPVKVSTTLEGCRNNGDITLPIGGRFVCPSNAYTTGNLGKGWSELDLVPFRLTLESPKNGPPTQTYTLAVVVDSKDDGKPGYDLLSTLTLRSGNCNASVGDEATRSPGLGGTDESRYRLITVTQPRDSTCVFDYYARLALGAHLYPGSALHANLANEDLSTAGIGASEVSIPVNEIAPQQLRKDMTATADSEVQWDLTKTTNPSSLAFADVCAAPGTPLSQKVSVRVEWKKVGTTAGGVTFITKVWAKNPAARTITVNVTDKVYKGTTPTGTALDTASSGPKDVAAGQEIVVLNHTSTLPASAGNVGDFLNDVATATYTDKDTGKPVPGTVEAAAKAKIEQGTVSNSSVAIADVESITGTGLSFSVDPVSTGNFTGYTPGSKTTGPVNWGVAGRDASGSVTFDKTVFLDARRSTSGKLSDTATLVATTGPFKKTASADVSISSNARVQLKIVKTVPEAAAAQLDPGERYEFRFRVTRSGDPSYKPEFTVSFGPGQTSKDVALLTGLVPDTYTVTELSAQFFAAGATTGQSVPLWPAAKDVQQTADLTAGKDGVFDDKECASTLTFANQPTGKGVFAQVQKLTDPPLSDTSPDFNWTFTLRGPGLPAAGVPVVAQAGKGFVKFNTGPLGEGIYTVTETQKDDWILTNVAPEMNADKACQFKVDLPEDDGKVLACTFSNQKKGKVKVIKTAKGEPLSGNLAFTFQLRQGATTTSAGTVLQSVVANAGNGGSIGFSTGLVPGNHYQLCEVQPSGWKADLVGFVPNAYLPGGTVPNPNADPSVVCVDFTVTAGQEKVFKVDNKPVPTTEPRTIGFWKNWSSCSSSNGHQSPVLDRTLALAEPGGLVVSATGSTVYLALHGSKATPDKAPNCLYAVRLLNKSTIDTGAKRASDPAFNLAAQLVAARLNYLAGAEQPAAVTAAINQAVALLGKVRFNGITHDAISAADAATMRRLAEILDNYNNGLF